MTRSDWLAAGWVLLVCAVFGWQAFTYRGIVATLGEWQFSTFGRYFPAMTVGLFVFVLSLPVIYFLSRRMKNSSLSEIDELRARAIRRFKSLRVAAIGFGIAALCTLAAILFLPGDTGPAPTVRATTGAVVPDGPATVTGPLIANRTVSYDYRLGLLTRTYRFAPIQPVAGGALSYFVEQPLADLPQSSTTERPGVVVRSGVPGAVLTLYRDAGYQVAKPAYAVFMDASAVRWPYFAAAVQLALIALLLAAGSFFQKRQIARIEKLVERIG